MNAVFPWLIPLSVVLIVAVTVLRMAQGVRTLRAQGRSIRPVLPGGALFGESGVSGCSEASLITRIGGASRILLVSVTNAQFVVESIFPFNVFMFQNPYDIEHRVPIHSLTHVEQVDARSVRVRFNDEHQKAHSLRLCVKRPADLVSTLASLGVPSNKSLERTREG